MTRYTALIAMLSILPGTTAAGGNAFDVSPDITIDLDTLIITDEDLVREGLTLDDLGAIPENAALTAFHRLENGDRLFSLDTTVVLPGPQLSRPGDVIRFDGTDYTLEFDGLANGVPSGAGIDALSADQADRLILSFDVTLMLDGDVVADEDLTKFNGSGFDQVFDASANGIDGALDLDAVHFEQVTQRLVVSFSSHGSVAGTAFSDEDLLIFNPDGGQWSLAFDGSTMDPQWIAADLDAMFAVLVNGDVIFYGGFESLIQRNKD